MPRFSAFSHLNSYIHLQSLSLWFLTAFINILLLLLCIVVIDIVVVVVVAVVVVAILLCDYERQLIQLCIDT
jgi:hypothetical protein